MLSFLFSQTPLKFFVQSFWRDEAFTYLLSIKSLPEITSLTAQDFNPPFYYWFMHFWIKLFGQSEVTLRLPSLIFFCATIYIIYLILTEVFKINWKTTYILLLLFILNPGLHYYAFEARMYSMVVFFVTLSYYALFKKQLWLYFAAIVFGLYTHYFVFFTIIAQLVSFWLTHKNHNTTGLFLRHLIIIFFVYLPWIIYMIINHRFFPQKFWIENLDASSWINLPTIIYSGFERELKLKVSLWQFNLILIGFLIISFIYYRKKITLEKDSLIDRSIIVHLFLWTFLPPIILLIISIFYPLFLPRYFLYSTIGFILLIIKLSKYSPKWLVLILTIALLLFTDRYVNQQVKLRTKHNLRKIITSIKKMSQPNDLLFVNHEFNYHVAQYYFPANKVFILGKTYEDIPVYVGKVLIPKGAIATQIPIYPERAFLLKENGDYSIISQE